MSRWFSEEQFRCPCCGGLKIDDRLIDMLDGAVAQLESVVGEVREVVVTSGYRCEAHNRDVGGYHKSFHLIGKAADTMPRVVGVDAVDVMRLWFFALIRAGFNGVGYTNGYAVHADMREYPGVSPQVWAPKRKVIGGKYYYLLK